jgi:hypothetical protein
VPLPETGEKRERPRKWINHRTLAGDVFRDRPRFCRQAIAINNRIGRIAFGSRIVDLLSN